MKTIIFSCLLILISFLISSCAASRIAQAPTEKTYNIKLVKGIHTDTVTKTSTAVIFAITPKQMIDFAPVLSMKVRYSVNDSTY